LLCQKENIIAEKQNIIAEKQNIIAEKQNIIAEKQTIIVEKEAEIYDLRFQLDQLRRALFGSKSERFVPENVDQLRFDFDMGEEVVAESQKEDIAYTRLKKGKKPARPNPRLPIPAHLERVVETIEPETYPKVRKR